MGYCDHSGVKSDKHTFYRKGRVDSDRRDREPRIWESDEKHGRVYFTCPECARILTVRRGEVNAAGVVRDSGDCVTCVCKYHSWPYLEGWASETIDHTARRHWWSFRRPA